MTHPDLVSRELSQPGRGLQLRAIHHQQAQQPELHRLPRVCAAGGAQPRRWGEARQEGARHGRRARGAAARGGTRWRRRRWRHLHACAPRPVLASSWASKPEPKSSRWKMAMAFTCRKQRERRGWVVRQRLCGRHCAAVWRRRRDEEVTAAALPTRLPPAAPYLGLQAVEADGQAHELAGCYNVVGRRKGSGSGGGRRVVHRHIAGSRHRLGARPASRRERRGAVAGWHRAITALRPLQDAAQSSN